MELSVIDHLDASKVEQAVTEFARASNGGMVVTASPFGANHPEMIATLATRYKLPAVYPFRYFIAAGGLMSYGPELISQSAHAADYVDRILKGKNRQTYRYKCRPNTRSSSILRPRRHSVSMCQRRCSRAPTRLSNEAAGIYFAARRGGGVTVRGERAAGQQNSPHRRVVAFFSIGHGTLTPNVFATP